MIHKILVDSSACGVVAIPETSGGAWTYAPTQKTQYRSENGRLIQQRLKKGGAVWQENETWNNFVDQEALLFEDIKRGILKNGLKNGTVDQVIVFRSIGPAGQLTFAGTVVYDFKKRCVQWGRS